MDNQSGWKILYASTTLFKKWTEYGIEMSQLSKHFSVFLA